MKVINNLFTSYSQNLAQATENQARDIFSIRDILAAFRGISGRNKSSKIVDADRYLNRKPPSVCRFRQRKTAFPARLDLNCRELVDSGGEGRGSVVRVAGVDNGGRVSGQSHSYLGAYIGIGED